MGGADVGRPPTTSQTPPPPAAGSDAKRPQQILCDVTARTVDQSVDAPRPVGPGWVRVGTDTLPVSVRPALGRLEPRPAGSTRPTVGLFNGEEITSGGGDRSLAGDLDHDPLRGPPVTFYDHVESKVAAHMRRTGATEADLAIDNTVCGTNDRDKSYVWTCDKVLPAILPPGGRLRVWVTRDGGSTWWQRVYTGTGERITR